MARRSMAKVVQCLTQVEPLMVTPGIEGGRSVVAGARATGLIGTDRSEAGQGATSSSRPGGDGSQKS